MGEIFLDICKENYIKTTKIKGKFKILKTETVGALQKVGTRMVSVTWILKIKGEGLTV